MADIENLIRNCQKKSKKAFDELYKTYSPFIYGICLRYTKDTYEAQDLMQDCFIKILNKIGDYEFKGSFEGWMRRLTVNSAINFINARKNIYPEDIDEHEIPEKDFDNDILSEMSAKEIMGMINKLPTGYRTVFNLYVIEGYKHGEIAEMLGITENTCRTQFKKARKSLMKLITENYNERF